MMRRPRLGWNGPAAVIAGRVRRNRIGYYCEPDVLAIDNVGYFSYDNRKGANLSKNRPRRRCVENFVAPQIQGGSYVVMLAARPGKQNDASPGNGAIDSDEFASGFLGSRSERRHQRKKPTRRPCGHSSGSRGAVEARSG